MKLTKRGTLAKLATIYDTLGLLLPETLCGNLIYRSVCDSKRAWDAELSCDMAKAWIKWQSSLPQSFEVPRLLAIHREEIDLIAARSRLSKQGLTISWLELIAGHMAVNLITNVREAHEGLPLTSMHCWLDSLVALYWIRGQEHKQFMSNRVQKINSHHIPTAENPANLRSRRGRLEEADQW